MRARSTVMVHDVRSWGFALLALLALTGSVVPARATPLPYVPLAASSGAWTVYHRDDGHTGNDPTLPTVSSVNTGWTSAALDEQVYAEPLIYNGIVYTATLNNTVYALRQSDGTEAWRNNLGAPETGGWDCGNVSPQGILGTPVIDVSGGRIYVAAFFVNDAYHVIGLNLVTGLIERDITLAITGFTWQVQQQRGALALRNGFVYVPFGGRAGDCTHPNPPGPAIPYHGYVVGVPTSGTAPPNVYVTPDAGIGIWTAGGIVVDDVTGNVFAATGNGILSGCNSVNQNDAVVRLSPTLALQDYFMPNDWQGNWCGNDQDLGSASPLLIAPNLLFQSGKWGMGFLLDPNALGGVDGQLFPTPKPNPYTEAPLCMGQNNDATFGSFAYAAPFIYIECERPGGGLGLVAIKLDTSVPATPTFSTCPTNPCTAPNWHAGGTTRFGPPIVAGGAVWVASDGGGLYAFNATTGAQIYHSAAFGMNRFVTPAEAGGQVFVPSHNVIRSFTMGFLAWNSLGGAGISGPDASSWGASRTDVFVRGADAAVWHKFWNGTSWSGWESLGGVITSEPSAVSWGPNRIDLFVRGGDYALWHRSFDGTTWTGWASLGGVITSSPDAASWGANHLDVFVRGGDNALWKKTFDGTTWNWSSLGGVITSDPGAVSSASNRIDVFVRGGDNALWHNTWNGTSWSWSSLGGVLPSGADPVSCSAGHLDVYVLGGDSAVWTRGFDGATWSNWQRLGGQWTAEPGAVCPPGTTTVNLFERGQDTGLWQTTLTGS